MVVVRKQHFMGEISVGVEEENTSVQASVTSFGWWTLKAIYIAIFVSRDSHVLNFAFTIIFQNYQYNPTFFFWGEYNPTLLAETWEDNA